MRGALLIYGLLALCACDRPDYVERVRAAALDTSASIGRVSDPSGADCQNLLAIKARLQSETGGMVSIDGNEIRMPRNLWDHMTEYSRSTLAQRVLEIAQCDDEGGADPGARVTITDSQSNEIIASGSLEELRKAGPR